MRLTELASAVRALFDELDPELAAFAARADLSCPAGCVECCLNPVVHATVLEFLPLAFRLVRDGRAEEILDRIASGQPGCALVAPAAGGCSCHADRGLICRLFSASVRPLRDGSLQYVACALLHERIGRTVPAEFHAPVIADWGRRLESIDLSLGSRQYPVNEALRIAIERVLFAARLEADAADSQ